VYRSAISPSDCAIRPDFVWTQWTQVLNYVGYKLVETEEISELSFEFPTSIWLVFSAEDRDNPKLPVSNMIVDDWKVERRRIALEFCGFPPSDYDMDDSLSAAGDVDENTRSWEDDSDATT
jgi:hypothetical protein